MDLILVLGPGSSSVVLLPVECQLRGLGLRVDGSLDDDDRFALSNEPTLLGYGEGGVHVVPRHHDGPEVGTVELLDNRSSLRLHPRKTNCT